MAVVIMLSAKEVSSHVKPSPGSYLTSTGYVLPNDEREQDRLDIHHHMTNLVLGGKLHLAPIGKTPQRILDIGTGTGIWAIEMGMPIQESILLLHTDKPVLTATKAICIRLLK